MTNVAIVLGSLLLGIAAGVAAFTCEPSLERQCDLEVADKSKWVIECAKVRGFDQCRRDAPYLHPLPACVRLAREVE